MDEPKNEPKNEPCLIYAQKVQDCLAENKFDVPNVDLGYYARVFEKGIFLSKLHVGHDGTTMLYVEDKSMIKKMRDEDMNKGIFCWRARFYRREANLYFRKKAAGDMMSDK